MAKKEKIAQNKQFLLLSPCFQLFIRLLYFHLNGVSDFFRVCLQKTHTSFAILLCILTISYMQQIRSIVLLFYLGTNTENFYFEY